MLDPESSSPELTVPFTRLRAYDLPAVGGKGANLGELIHAGFPVPLGFCVTTTAFRLFLQAAPGTDGLYSALDSLEPEDTSEARRLSERWQTLLRGLPMPDEVAKAILKSWRVLGADTAYAIRSSATAEDLPDASFAGQQDTFLNVRGAEALLVAVQECWASLFTERAILYRQQHGVGHRHVALAVAVQQMVDAEVSGILFTADPLSGARSVCAIDASFGLGEALVGGLVSADAFRIDRHLGRVLERRISDKGVAIWPEEGGGVRQIELTGKRRTQAALSDVQALDLAALGGRIEAHYGAPQDIEWAWADGQWFILQSRPITTLFPLPEPEPADDWVHAYLSFSHFQVMTDAMPPLATSVWRVLFPFGQQPGVLENPMLTAAGGRLYADVSSVLRHPWLRRVVPRVLNAAVDPLIGGALTTLAARPEFARGPALHTGRAVRGIGPIIGKALGHLLRPETHASGRALNAIEQEVRRVEAQLQAAPDITARLDVAMEKLSGLLHGAAGWLVPQIVAGLMVDQLVRLLCAGSASSADVAALTRGLSGNVTTEMDLALGDLADAARNFLALRERLGQHELSTAERLNVMALPGGAAFLPQWRTFLARYGARGPSEIDLSRPRWREDSTSLLGMLVANLSHPVGSTHRTQVARLAAEAHAAEARLERAAGPVQRKLLRHLLRAVRVYLPMREHGKYLIVRVLDVVKPVVLESAVILSARGQLGAVQDVWLLSLPELRGALTERDNLTAMVAERRRRFQHESRLVPPRVMTSDGEQIRASHTDDSAPAGALVGQGVSSGVIEGLIRVIRDPRSETLQAGEILVAPFTDPGWTPLFVTAAGLVTEVGGMMTHGSLVAREYGLPAVVGVSEATRRLRTGQRVRVNGTLGYVQVLDDETLPEVRRVRTDNHTAETSA